MQRILCVLPTHWMEHFLHWIKYTILLVQQSAVALIWNHLPVVVLWKVLPFLICGHLYNTSGMNVTTFKYSLVSSNLRMYNMAWKHLTTPIACLLADANHCSITTCKSSEMAISSNSGERSYAWKYSEKTSSKNVTCRLCSKQLAYHGGTQTLETTFVFMWPNTNPPRGWTENRPWRPLCGSVLALKWR